MAIRNIVKDGDPILKKRCRPVEKFDKKLAVLLEDMAETMYEANGVGLAAPQVGMLRRVVVIDVGDGVIELVNPRIIANSTKKSYLENGEACLSVVPDVEGIVPRYARITVRAYNLLDDQVEDIRLSGYPAIVMQHEIDHLYGKLYYDHINKNNPWMEPLNAIPI